MSKKSGQPEWVVVAAACPRPFVIEATFVDGFSREIDVTEELWGGIFEPLKDQAFFMQGRFDAERGTISWPNGADLAPEFLRWGRHIPPELGVCACGSAA